MATCKDCLHCEACTSMLQSLGYTVAAEHRIDAEKFCKQFKNKNEYAKVQHGRWIIDKERLKATCSECGNTLHFSDEMQICLLGDNERFCYYCGAIMDGKAEGNR